MKLATLLLVGLACVATGCDKKGDPPASTATEGAGNVAVGAGTVAVAASGAGPPSTSPTPAPPAPGSSAATVVAPGVRVDPTSVAVGGKDGGVTVNKGAVNAGGVKVEPGKVVVPGLGTITH